MLRTPTRHRLLTAFAAAVLGVTLAGCGSSGDAGLTVTNQAKDPDAARSLGPSPAAPSVAASPMPDATGAVVLAGVTVTDALDLAAEPAITSTATGPAAGLVVQDLVVGDGESATPTSAAKLHYKGVLYVGGKQFDTNWDADDPQEQQLGQAITGFSQGVGGTTGVEPMRVGGRRLMVFPATLGYGAIPYGEIPAYSSLVFVVDLLDLP